MTFPVENHSRYQRRWSYWREMGGVCFISGVSLNNWLRQNQFPRYLFCHLYYFITTNWSASNNFYIHVLATHIISIIQQPFDWWMNHWCSYITTILSFHQRILAFMQVVFQNWYFHPGIVPSGKLSDKKTSVWIRTREPWFITDATIHCTIVRQVAGQFDKVRLALFPYISALPWNSGL